jgi:hypothetical protein
MAFLCPGISDAVLLKNLNHSGMPEKVILPAVINMVT